MESEQREQDLSSFSVTELLEKLELEHASLTAYKKAIRGFVILIAAVSLPMIALGFFSYFAYKDSFALIACLAIGIVAGLGMGISGIKPVRHAYKKQKGQVIAQLEDALKAKGYDIS
jgi:hypothetical protein